METLDPRVPGASRAQLGSRENLAREAALEQMDLVGCLESQVPRVTGALMACLGFLERRDTGERQEDRAL